MEVVGRSAIRILVGVLLATGLAHPSSALASETAGAIVVVGGHTVLAHVGDLDGDGDGELVRVTSNAEGTGFALEAWYQDGDEWRTTESLPLPGSSADVRTALGWNDGTRERVLLATVTSPGAGLDIRSVARRGDELSVASLATSPGTPDVVQTADLDADGTDELIVTDMGSDGNGPPILQVLRWNGDRFQAEEVDLGDDVPMTIPIIGDSDGVPGDDLVFGTSARTAVFRFVRFASGTVQTGELPLDDSVFFAFPTATADGAIYLNVQSAQGTGIVGVEWPARATPAVTASIGSDEGTRRLQSLTLGDEVVVLDEQVLGRPPSSVIVRDARLEPLTRISPSPAIERSRTWRDTAIGLGDRLTGAIGLSPYQGPIPGGIGGRPAAVANGHLITTGEGGFEVRPTGSFIGIAPLGLVGRDDGWMAITRSFWHISSDGYVAPPPPELLDGSVVLAPAASVLSREGDDGELEVELHDAVRIDGPDGAVVASGDGGFGAQVRGTPGSRVAAISSAMVDVTDEVVADGQLTLRLDPGRRGDTNAEYSLTMVMISPTGQVRGTEWQGRVLREPPNVEAVGETITGALEAIVTGRTDSNARVTVDGTAVPIGPNGSFETPVSAGITPREVVVAVRDVVGNESSVRVEVLGLVDYRTWPWLPILGVVVVLVAIGMYVRAPRGKPIVTAGGGDGTIEEIETR